MSSISTSSRQRFANNALDACEHYFTGKRVPHEKDEEKWWVTALRVSSWFTVVLPLGFAATFVLAKALQSPDNTMKKYWKGRIHVSRKSSVDKKSLINMLIRSGITQTTFDHIYFISARRGGEMKFNVVDGPFPSANEGKTFDDRKKTLVLTIANKSLHFDNKSRYGWNQLNSQYIRGAKEIYPSTPRILAGADFAILNRFEKIPNQMKAILQAAPDFINDVEPDASHLDGQAT